MISNDQQTFRLEMGVVSILGFFVERSLVLLHICLFQSWAEAWKIKDKGFIICFNGWLVKMLGLIFFYEDQIY